jgi:hypothetical protein
VGFAAEVDVDCHGEICHQSDLVDRLAGREVQSQRTHQIAPAGVDQNRHFGDRVALACHRAFLAWMRAWNHSLALARLNESF